MSNQDPRDRPTGRTKIITAASIGAVGVAGLFAISANLGILSGTAQSNVGTVSAAGELVPADTRVVDVYVDQQGDPVTPTTTTAAGSQRFLVDEAGTVEASIGATGARVDRITPARGWTAREVPSAGGEARVTFSDGARTLEFTATVAADGTIAGSVDEAATAAAPTPTTRPAPTSHEADDDEYEGGESDD